MSIVVDGSTRVLVQGFTGRIGSFHAEEMIEYGTDIAGGGTPGRGGSTHLDRPVFDTVKDAVEATGAQASIVFVPPPYAAGALMGLNVLWDLKLNRQELVPFAARLGMDIPFFLTSPAAVGRGRGEILDSVQPSKKFKVLLILPRIKIATTWAYRNLNLKLTNRGNNISILQKFLSQSEIGRLGASLFNNLEPVVIERFPVIQTIKNKLRDQNAKGVLMSGSGSSVFGLFDDPEQAKTAYTSFENGDWDRSLTETIATFDEFLPEEILNYPK